MNTLALLAANLNEIISLEHTESIEILGSYIVGELLGDYDDTCGGLRKENPSLERIADLAGDLERANGNNEQLLAMWSEIKQLVASLSQEVG